MSRFFDMDSPVMRFLSKVADLLILNIITALCCIPIITIGASMTALHYVLLKMVRNEEGYIVRSFFKSFKENFKQATIIWAIILAFILVFVGDLFIMNYAAIAFPTVLKMILLALAFFVFIVCIYVFPVLSRFDNSIRNTWKNALFMSVLSLPKTILMVIIYAVPIVLIFFVPMAIPFVLMFGIAAPAYFCAMLYSGTFKRFEPEEEQELDGLETDNESM